MLAVPFNDVEENMLKSSALYNNTNVIDFVRETVMKRAREEKEARNKEYLEMIDRGLKQMAEGHGRSVTNEEMEMMLSE